MIANATHQVSVQLREMLFEIEIEVERTLACACIGQCVTLLSWRLDSSCERHVHDPREEHGRGVQVGRQHDSIHHLDIDPEETERHEAHHDPS